MSCSNQLINSKHLQRSPEPLNVLSLWLGRFHNHGEGKHWHPQKVIAKEADCSQSAVSEHVHRKLSEGNRDNCSLERIVKQRPFKKFGGTSQGSEPGVGEWRATTHRRIQYVGSNCRVKLLPNQRLHQKCPTWAKEKKNWSVAQWTKVSSFQMKVNFAFNLKIKVPESGDNEWRGTEQMSDEPSQG